MLHTVSAFIWLQPVNMLAFWDRNENSYWSVCLCVCVSSAAQLHYYVGTNTTSPVHPPDSQFDRSNSLAAI